jgi:hypothetical protein
LLLKGDAEIEHAIEVGNSKDNPARQQHIGAIDTSVEIAGDDGLVYLMRATSPAVVYAISAAGEVARKITVAPPGGTGSPQFGLRVSKNRLVVQFRRNCVVRWRGDTNVKVAPRHAPGESYELGPVIAALEDRHFSERDVVNDLVDAASLLRPRLGVLSVSAC